MYDFKRPTHDFNHMLILYTHFLILLFRLCAILLDSTDDALPYLEIVPADLHLYHIYLFALPVTFSLMLSFVILFNLLDSVWFFFLIFSIKFSWEVCEIHIWQYTHKLPVLLFYPKLKIIIIAPRQLSTSSKEV